MLGRPDPLSEPSPGEVILSVGSRPSQDPAELGLTPGGDSWGESIPDAHSDERVVEGLLLLIGLVCMDHTVYSLSGHGHWGCFYFRSIINNDAVTIHV